jgi:hypothetical protein
MIIRPELVLLGLSEPARAEFACLFANYALDLLLTTDEKPFQPGGLLPTSKSAFSLA